MQADRSALEERVARLERSVTAISARLDSISGKRRGEQAESGTAPRTSPAVAPRPRPHRANPLAGKSAEWWLARGGAVLTSLALILLYDYAVERSWITPIVRVLMGTAVGVALMVAASRVTRRSDRPTDAVAVGLREVLLGAALSAWYITAYAAAVYYQLISLAGARLLFLGLSLVGAWLALSERRAILALLALGAGFATPQLLPSASPSIPAFALFLAALTAVGLVLYLMRGWQSVLWLTFVAFWLLAGEAASLACCEAASGPARITGSYDAARIAISLLIVAAGAAMTRVPVLRRKLLTLGSPLYTEPVRSERIISVQKELTALVRQLTGRAQSADSPALWIIGIASSLFSLYLLSLTWITVSGMVWGVASLGAAAFAYRIANSGNTTDDEVAHVGAAATALLSLAGILWVGNSLGNRMLQAADLMLAGAALHAFATLYWLRTSGFVAARGIGFWTAGVLLATVVFWEAGRIGSGNVQPGTLEAAWTSAEMLAIGVAAWIWWTFRRPGEPASMPALFGVAAYLALLLIDARILGRIWPPLVTASFAIAGTGLLILARGRPAADTLRRLGGFTLIVVVVRLMLVDLAAVGTIWRVLLFLGCGALFLLTSYLLQGTRAETAAEAR